METKKAASGFQTGYFATEEQHQELLTMNSLMADLTAERMVSQKLIFAIAHVLRYGKLGKQSERRLREVLREVSA